MQLNRLGHAALMIETAGVRILCDPGSFSSDWHGQTDLDAVMVTHQHLDHVDVPRLVELMAANPGARLVVEPAVLGMVESEGLSAETAVVGEALEVGPVRVEVRGGTHALIHDTIPRVGNVGYLFSQGDGPRLYHPGDSYDEVPEGVDVLALPISAPWAKVAATADFLAAVSPTEALPIHDAILSDTGRGLYLRVVEGIVGDGVRLHHIGPTGTLSL